MTNESKPKNIFDNTDSESEDEIINVTNKNNYNYDDDDDDSNVVIFNKSGEKVDYVEKNNSR